MTGPPVIQPHGTYDSSPCPPGHSPVVCGEAAAPQLQPIIDLNRRHFGVVRRTVARPARDHVPLHRPLPTRRRRHTISTAGRPSAGLRGAATGRPRDSRGPTEQLGGAKSLCMAAEEDKSEPVLGGRRGQGFIHANQSLRRVSEDEALFSRGCKARGGLGSSHRQRPGPALYDTGDTALCPATRGLAQLTEPRLKLLSA